MCIDDFVINFKHSCVDPDDMMDLQETIFIIFRRFLSKQSQRTRKLCKEIRSFFNNHYLQIIINDFRTLIFAYK